MDALGWNWLSSDIVRKGLAGPFSPRGGGTNPSSQGIYAPDFSKITYQTLFAQAGALLQAGSSVILDASFRRGQDRSAAWNWPEKRGGFSANRMPLRRRDHPEEAIRPHPERKRIFRRKMGIFQEQKASFEKIRGWDPDLHLSLDTGFPLEEGLQRIFRHLLQREAKLYEKEERRLEDEFIKAFLILMTTIFLWGGCSTSEQNRQKAVLHTRLGHHTSSRGIRPLPSGTDGGPEIQSG